MHDAGARREISEIPTRAIQSSALDRSGMVPDQLKMTNSPSTCKIAIFRRRSAVGETADTQSERFLAGLVTTIGGIGPTSPSPTRPTSFSTPATASTKATPQYDRIASPVIASGAKQSRRRDAILAGLSRRETARRVAKRRALRPLVCVVARAPRNGADRRIHLACLPKQALGRCSFAVATFRHRNWIRKRLDASFGLSARRSRHVDHRT